MAPGQGDPSEDLEALDHALGALREEGVGAQASDLDGAIAVFTSLEETGKESEETYEDSDTEDVVSGGLEALQRIADGEGDADDVEKADAAVNIVGQSIQKTMLDALVDGL